MSCSHIAAPALAVFVLAAARLEDVTTTAHRIAFEGGSILDHKLRATAEDVALLSVGTSADAKATMVGNTVENIAASSNALATELPSAPRLLSADLLGENGTLQNHSNSSTSWIEATRAVDSAYPLGENRTSQNQSNGSTFGIQATQAMDSAYPLGENGTLQNQSNSSTSGVQATQAVDSAYPLGENGTLQNHSNGSTSGIQATQAMDSAYPLGESGTRQNQSNSSTSGIQATQAVHSAYPVGENGTPQNLSNWSTSWIQATRAVDSAHPLGENGTLQNQSNWSTSWFQTTQAGAHETSRAQATDTLDKDATTQSPSREAYVNETIWYLQLAGFLVVFSLSAYLALVILAFVVNRCNRKYGGRVVKSMATQLQRASSSTDSAPARTKSFRRRLCEDCLFAWCCLCVHCAQGCRRRSETKQLVESPQDVESARQPPQPASLFLYPVDDVPKLRALEAWLSRPHQDPPENHDDAVILSGVLRTLAAGKESPPTAPAEAEIERPKPKSESKAVQPPPTPPPIDNSYTPVRKSSKGQKPEPVNPVPPPLDDSCTPVRRPSKVLTYSGLREKQLSVDEAAKPFNTWPKSRARAPSPRYLDFEKNTKPTVTQAAVRHRSPAMSEVDTDSTQDPRSRECSQARSTYCSDSSPVAISPQTNRRAERSISPASSEPANARHLFAEIRRRRPGSPEPPPPPSRAIDGPRVPIAPPDLEHSKHDQTPVRGSFVIRRQGRSASLPAKRELEIARRKAAAANTSPIRGVFGRTTNPSLARTPTRLEADIRASAAASTSPDCRNKVIARDRSPPVSPPSGLNTFASA